MAAGIATVVVLWAIAMIFLGPKLTSYNRRKWALLMTTLIVLWLPMGVYLMLTLASSEEINPQHVALAGALNLAIGVPLFILVVRKWILK